MKNEATKLQKCINGALVLALVAYVIDASIRVTRAESRTMIAEKQRDEWRRIAEAEADEARDLFYELDYYKWKEENKEKES